MELVHKQFGTIRAEIKPDGSIWFVAKDVCNALGLSDVSMSLKKLDDDEKLIQKIFVSGQRRDVWMINESGLYALILRSNKPEAKKFRKWVTNEVLPALRKQGYYEISQGLNEGGDDVKVIIGVMRPAERRELARRLYNAGVELSRISRIVGVSVQTLKQWERTALFSFRNPLDGRGGLTDKLLDVILEAEPKKVRVKLFEIYKELFW